MKGEVSYEIKCAVCKRDIDLDDVCILDLVSTPNGREVLKAKSIYDATMYLASVCICCYDKEKACSMG